jgi:outer membrane murein-binding lipoprotein Lpp
MSDKIEMLTMKIEELEATVERLYKENKQLKQKVK